MGHEMMLFNNVYREQEERAKQQVATEHPCHPSTHNLRQEDVK